MRRFVIALGLALGLAASAATATNAQRGSGLIQPDVSIGRPGQTCSTRRVRDQRRGWRTAEALLDGRPVSFIQEPSIIPPNYTGTVVFRDFYVAGDVATISFKAFNPDAPAAETETWTRTGTTEINGRLVSVFNPSWPAQRLADVMRRTVWGFDYPFIYWGEVVPAGVSIGQGYFIYLRVGSSGLPAVSVTRLADDVQYSANVVNIRNDAFAARRLGADENDLNVEAVTRRFYDLFEDTYDTISLTTQDVQVSRSNAFHVNIKNEVSGIGEPLRNDAATLGSGGRLSSVEIFYGPHVTTHATGAHELSHQWGAYIDWTQLNGLVRAGHQPAAHDPLMSGGETLIGAVLDGTRRVTNTGAAWVIERTPFPIRFHPLTLYAMGLLPAAQVPEITLFNDQGQFGGDTTPDPGTPVAGDVRTATISNVIGMLGARSGPVPAEWHRAIVVVSRGRLLTQEEMNYWTFFAQRNADPNRSGVASYDGFASFDLATGNAINLRHEIRPKASAALVQSFGVDYPNFGTVDLRDIVLDAPLPTLVTAGQQLRVSGRITDTSHGDFQLQVYFVADGGGLDGFRMVANAASNGSFVLQGTPETTHRGRYMLQVYMLWPGGPAQTPRSIVGPFTIN